ncbi:hypothetical protein C0991_004088, partial [Blastosporella zonata]
ILLPPEPQTPVSSSSRNLPCHVLMRALPVRVSTEEGERVREVGKIRLDGDVVYPGGEAVSEPMWGDEQRGQGGRIGTHHSG